MTLLSSTLMPMMKSTCIFFLIASMVSTKITRRWRRSEFWGSTGLHSIGPRDDHFVLTPDLGNLGFSVLLVSFFESPIFVRLIV